MQYPLKVSVEEITAHMEAQFEGTNFEIDPLKSNVKRLEDEKEDLFLKVDDLENRAKHNNLVLHGIPEPDVDRGLYFIESPV